MSKSIYFSKRLSLIYSGKPWYGKPIVEFIKIIDLDNEDIQKILSHMLVWRNYAINKLEGGDSTVQPDSSEDWPAIKFSNAKKLIDAFELNQSAFVNLVEGFDDTKWNNQVLDRSFTFEQLIQGVIDHDLYHLGQVAFLSRKN